MENKGQRGGARPGSGRPQTNRTWPLMVRVSEEAIKKLDLLTDNRSEYLDSLILKQPLKKKRE